jgi:hypothetical protein
MSDSLDTLGRSDLVSGQNITVPRKGPTCWNPTWMGWNQPGWGSRMSRLRTWLESEKSWGRALTEGDMSEEQRPKANGADACADTGSRPVGLAKVHVLRGING